MNYKPGQLLDALVDGEPAIIYLSLRAPWSEDQENKHGFRYAPPSHKPVTGVVKILQHHEDNDRSLRPDLLYGKRKG